MVCCNFILVLGMMKMQRSWLVAFRHCPGAEKLTFHLPSWKYFQIPELPSTPS
jgi:hypothetical protein